MTKQLCEYGMTYGQCCDEFPPFKIMPGTHEVESHGETMYLCSYCLQTEIIDDIENGEKNPDDYDLTLIEKDKLDDWNKKRETRRNNWLVRSSK